MLKPGDMIKKEIISEIPVIDKAEKVIVFDLTTENAKQYLDNSLDICQVNDNVNFYECFSKTMSSCDIT